MIKHKIEQLVMQYEGLGTMELENGTVLVGKAPHVGSEAWLHELFKPLSKDDCNEIESELKTKLPREYKDYLTSEYNGLRIFVTTFSLYGLKKQLGRSVETAAQPFSILTSNTIEKPKNAQDNFFFIGGYGKDSSKLYIDKETDKVHYCKRNDATSLLEWNSFNEMMSSELIRIFSLFDEEGKKKNEEVATIPV